MSSGACAFLGHCYFRNLLCPLRSLILKGLVNCMFTLNNEILTLMFQRKRCHCSATMATTFYAPDDKKCNFHGWHRQGTNSTVRMF